MTEKEIHIEQLMMEKLTGLIGEEDARYLEELLQSDEEIQQQWEKIKETFERSEVHHYLQNMDTERGWMKVREGVAKSKKNRELKRRILLIAASLIAPLILAGLFFYRGNPRKQDIAAANPANSVKLYVSGAPAINLSRYKASAGISPLKNVSLKVGNGRLSYAPLNSEVSGALNTLVVPATATYAITLSDGTQVSLNSMSQLKFAFTFSQNKREVWLSGEAYFRVAKDPDRPFVVHARSTEITVLGTEFNVNTYDSEQVRTALVSGSVSTQAAGRQPVMLKPGYAAVFSPEKGFGVTAFDLDNELSWMRGIYYFRNATLENIAPVIHRWYGDTILFDDAPSASTRFTGAMLKDKPLKEFLDNLALTSNIRYYSIGTAIHVETK